MLINKEWHFYLLHNEPALVNLVELLGQMQTVQLLSACKNNMRSHFLANKLTVAVRTRADLQKALQRNCKRMHVAAKRSQATLINGNLALKKILACNTLTKI